MLLIFNKAFLQAALWDTIVLSFLTVRLIRYIRLSGVHISWTGLLKLRRRVMWIKNASSDSRTTDGDPDIASPCLWLQIAVWETML